MTDTIVNEEIVTDVDNGDLATPSDDNIISEETITAEIDYEAEYDEDGHIVNSEADEVVDAEAEVVGDSQEVEDNPADFIAEKEALFKNLSDEKLDLISLYETEYIANGDYSEETYKALEAKGWAKEAIDIVSESIEIKAKEFASKLITAAGGESEYQALQAWSKQKGNATDAELKRYNEAVNKGDLSYAKLQLDSWRGKYVQVKGSKPKETLQGLHAGKSSNGLKGFESMDEYADALNDPRYAKGGAYQREVQARRLASNFKY